MKTRSPVKKRLLVFHIECTQLRGGEKYIYELVKRVSPRVPTELFIENISPYWRSQYNKLHVSVHLLWKPKHLYWPLLPITLGINYVLLQRYLSQNDTVFVTNFPLSFLTTLLSKKTILFCFEPLSVFYDSFRIKQSGIRERFLLAVIKFFYAPLDRLAIRRATMVATLNKEVDNAMYSLYKKRANFYIPNGVDTSHFSPKKRPLYKKRGGYIIGHSTDYSPLKGTEVLLRATPQIIRAHPNARIYISESMNNKHTKQKYINLIKTLHMQKYVFFIGCIPENQLPNFYASCDVFCYTGSTQCVGGSSASLSVLEAQSCGIPVLRTVGNSDEIIPNKTGLYFTSEEPKHIADTINSFLSLSTRQTKTMGRAARAHCVQNFSWSVSSKQLLRHA
ncbi:MAG: glycosyltransferase [Microgenomates group bacterium]